MKPDIIEKLRRELSEPAASERQVVYILVEIRKLLELSKRARREANLPQDTTFIVLEFFCNWAVHPVMDYEDGKRLVRRFDQSGGYLKKISALRPGDAEPSDGGLMMEIHETIRVVKFRDQLKAFLRSHDLPSHIADSDDAWHSFLEYYVCVIEDCPLRCPKEGLNYTEEVIVRLIHGKTRVRPELSFNLAFQWCWKNKSTGTWAMTQSSF